MHLSIISPVYRGEQLLDQLVERVIESVSAISSDFEIILVDDFSPDNSWSKIEELAKRHPKVKGIKLSRNFGQHYAITAGLDHAKGEWIVVMDCDLQDRPEEIYTLYQKAQEGYEAVFAQRADRKDAFFKKLGSKVFYKTLAYLTGVDQDETVANFGIYNRRLISEIVQMREKIRFFPAMVKWVGFRQTAIPVCHSENGERGTTYSFKKLFNLALDIMLAYSDKPIRMTVKFGVGVAFTGFIFAVYTFIRYLLGDIIVAGYASLIISIWLLTGFLLITLGMVGLYVGKIFEGVKNRPVYIIDRITTKSE